MKGFELDELTFGDVTEYGLIGIIGLGSDASCQLEEIDFIESNKILTYNSYRNIDHKSIKQLCNVSDVVFVVVNLDDISVGKSIWGLISYVKSLNTNTIMIAKTSHDSSNLATTIKKRVPFLDLSKQENRDMLWTLKSLYRIIYYYNDEYNFQDAHYPPSMFWETFFKTNSEIFIYHSNSVYEFLEKMKIDNNINKKLNISEYCLLSCTNIVSSGVVTLLNRIEDALGVDTYFYRKYEEFNNPLLFLSI